MRGSRAAICVAAHIERNKGKRAYVGRRTEQVRTSRDDCSHQPRRFTMLYTIAVILLILWALGLVSAFTMGGFIHVLLVIAVVVVLLRVISGRRPI
jgi:hypothetical protein